MVTIVQGSPDLRKQALEQGVGVGIQNFFKERQDKQEQERFLQAFKAINSAQSYEQAVAGLGTLDRRILSNPQALQMLSAQIDRKFPPQDAVQVEKGGVVQTVPTRKGDVAGAIAQAQEMGGRLAQDVGAERETSAAALKTRMEQDKFNLEQEKFGQKKELDAQKLALEERRTAAAELRARRTGMPKPGEKEKEIAALTQVLKVPMDRAIKLAYDYEKIDVIPETGEARLTDAISGKSVIVPQEMLDNPEAIPKPAEGQSLWEAARYATGPFSALRQAWSLPANYMGVFIPEKTEVGRQRLNMATQRLIRTLAINDRFPVAEQERIRKELALSPSIFIHPEALRRRMVTAHQTLTLYLAQAERDANPKSGLPNKERAGAKADANEIRQFLSQLAVPEEHLKGAVEPSAELPPNASKYFSPDEWSRLTPEEQQQWLNQF